MLAPLGAEQAVELRDMLLAAAADPRFRDSRIPASELGVSLMVYHWSADVCRTVVGQALLVSLVFWW